MVSQSNDQIADDVEQFVEQLRQGELTPGEFPREMAEYLASIEGVLSDTDGLRSQGRVSFGRPNEGREGIALFVPDPESRTDTCSMCGEAVTIFTKDAEGNLLCIECADIDPSDFVR